MGSPGKRVALIAAGIVVLGAVCGLGTWAMTRAGGEGPSSYDGYATLTSSEGTSTSSESSTTPTGSTTTSTETSTTSTETSTESTDSGRLVSAGSTTYEWDGRGWSDEGPSCDLGDHLIFLMETENYLVVQCSTLATGSRRPYYTGMRKSDRERISLWSEYTSNGWFRAEEETSSDVKYWTNPEEGLIVESGDDRMVDEDPVFTVQVHA